MDTSTASLNTHTQEEYILAYLCFVTAAHTRQFHILPSALGTAKTEQGPTCRIAMPNALACIMDTRCILSAAVCTRGLSGLSLIQLGSTIMFIFCFVHPGIWRHLSRSSATWNIAESVVIWSDSSLPLMTLLETDFYQYIFNISFYGCPGVFPFQCDVV